MDEPLRLAGMGKSVQRSDGVRQALQLIEEGRVTEASVALGFVRVTAPDTYVAAKKDYVRSAKKALQTQAELAIGSAVKCERGGMEAALKRMRDIEHKARAFDAKLSRAHDTNHSGEVILGWCQHEVEAKPEPQVTTEWSSSDRVPSTLIEEWAKTGEFAMVANSPDAMDYQVATAFVKAYDDGAWSGTADEVGLLREYLQWRASASYQTMPRMGAFLKLLQELREEFRD